LPKDKKIPLDRIFRRALTVVYIVFICLFRQ
jgi:hypothetical protein